MSALLKALAEPRRQQILKLVYDRELPAGEIHRSLSDVTFGAVSQHLRVLSEAGAVRMRRTGRQRLYRADKAALRPFRAHLEALWSGALHDLKRRAEDEEKPKRRPA